MTLCRAKVSALLTVCALVLCGCSSLTQPTEPAPVESTPRSGGPVLSPDQKSHKPASPPARAAWRPLLKKAQIASHRGDYEQAFAYLERAQRIDPDSAEVYLGMAQTHLARGDSARAKATAERGLLYCTTYRLCDALRAFVQ